MWRNSRTQRLRTEDLNEREISDALSRRLIGIRSAVRTIALCFSLT
jgi:hypothetical protein